MYIPTLEPLQWDWESINFEAVFYDDGPLVPFVEWCVGWHRCDEVKSSNPKPARFYGPAE